WRYGAAEEEVFSSIYYGRPKGMPAYGGVIGSGGVWTLVAYLKAKSLPSVVPTLSFDETGPQPSHEAPPPQTEPQSTGTQSPEQMLAKYGCVACHAMDRKVVGPS